jgi:hypothetical protein
MHAHNFSDAYQHCATAQSIGLRCPWFAIEVVQLKCIDGDAGTAGKLCTSGWSGVRIAVLGKTHSRTFHVDGVIAAPTPPVSRINNRQFFAVDLQTSSAIFLNIRIGRRRSRHQLVEAAGDQVASVIIESIKPRSRKDLDQVVISSTDDIDVANASEVSTAAANG